MGFMDKVRAAAAAVKSEAVIKAVETSQPKGYKPEDYAGFNGEGLGPEAEAKPKSHYQKWRERDINGEDS